MKPYQVVAILSLFLCATARAEDAPEIQGYQTFYEDAKAGCVKQVAFPATLCAGMDMTVTVLKDGKETTYQVDRPYRSVEDPVFLRFLADNKVPYSVEPEKAETTGFFSIFPIGTMLTLFGPTLLILVLLVVIVLRTGSIKRSVEAIASRTSRDTSAPPSA